MVFVHLKRSKTDQLRRGVTMVVGRTNEVPLCPVSALLNYLVAGSWPPIHLELMVNFLVEHILLQRFRRRLRVDSSDFNSHGFRIRVATTAAANGFEDSLIRTLGRWKSDVYRSYIKIPRQKLAHYTVMLTKIKTSYNVIYFGLGGTYVSWKVASLPCHFMDPKPHYREVFLRHTHVRGGDQGTSQRLLTPNDNGRTVLAQVRLLRADSSRVRGLPPKR